MERQNYLNGPMLLVTGERGTLAEFLAGLFYWATNADLPGVLPPSPNRFGHSNWFPPAEMPGTDDFYLRWLSISERIDRTQDPTGQDGPTTQLQKDAAEDTGDWWTPTPGVNRVLYVHAYQHASSLFADARCFVIGHKVTDIPQLAYNYITKECLLKGWDDFAAYLNDISVEDVRSRFSKRNHLRDQVICDLLDRVEDSYNSWPDLHTLLDSEMKRARDPSYDLICGMFYDQYTDPNNIDKTVSLIMHFLGDSCKVDADSVRKCLADFLDSVVPCQR